MSDENLEQNVSVEENSKKEKSAYKTFENREDFENFINEIKVKFTPDLKKQLEKEAKMTAEQRLQAKIQELEQDKKDLAIDKNRTKAERLFVGKGLSENSYSEILNFIVNEDENTTIERTNTLLKFIDTASRMIADEKIKSTMKSVAMPKNGTQSSEKDETGIAKTLGKIRANSEKTAMETVNRYK